MEQMDFWSKSGTTNQSVTMCWLRQLCLPLRYKYKEEVRIGDENCNVLEVFLLVLSYVVFECTSNVFDNKS